MNDTAKSPRFGRFPQLLGRIVFYALLVVIALTAIPYGTVQPWWISIFECAIFLLGMMAVIEMAISKDWQLEFRLVAPLIVLVIFAIVQSVLLFPGPEPIRPRIAISADPYGTRLFAMQLCALVVMVLLLLRYTNSSKRFYAVIYLVVGIGVASAVFGLVRQGLQSQAGFLLPALPIGGRSFGQFINRNHFAFLLELTFGLTLGLIVAAGRNYRRALVLAAVGALQWLAIIYSNSRGGIVASLCQLLFLGVLLVPTRYLVRAERETERSRISQLMTSIGARVFLIISLTVVLIYGVGWIGGEPVVSNFELATTDFSQQQMGNNVNTSRKEIWSATWRMIKANPITGIGFGGYWIAVSKYHRASGEMTPQQAHNDYLELMACGGVIGLGLAAWFGVIFIQRSRRTLKATGPYRKAISLGALTGIFGVALHSFVDFGLHIMVNIIVVFVLIAVVSMSSRLGASQSLPVRT